jgi:hypothetical protein
MNPMTYGLNVAVAVFFEELPHAVSTSAQATTADADLRIVIKGPLHLDPARDPHRAPAAAPCQA